VAFIDVQDLAGYLQVEVTEMGWLGEHSVRSAEDAVKGVLGHDPAWVENDEITLSGVGSSVLERLPILIGDGATWSSSTPTGGERSAPRLAMRCRWTSAMQRCPTPAMCFTQAKYRRQGSAERPHRCTATP